MNRFLFLTIALVSLMTALFLAWKIGLWMEPDPGGVPDVSISRPAGPPFASGKVRDDLQFDLREVKVTPEGRKADGIGIIRYTVAREDLNPAAEAMLKTLKGKAPAAEEMKLVLRPAVDCPVCDIAEVTWKKGVATLGYGIPSQQQIDEWNAKIGKNDGRPRLYIVDRETFSTGIAVIMAMDELKKKNATASEEELLDQAAKQTGVNYAKAKEARSFIKAYYTGNNYGSEKFDLPLP